MFRVTGESCYVIWKKKVQQKSYDSTAVKPVLKCSICNGEQVAGFKDLKSGAFSEEMLILNEADLKHFKELYGITGDIEKIY